MFAVPGWSVFADALKPQVESQISGNRNEYRTKDARGTKHRSTKRKRGQNDDTGTEVTENNLEALWKKHIEKGDPEAKRQKAEQKGDGENGETIVGEALDLRNGAVEVSTEKEIENGIEDGSSTKKRKKRKRKGLEDTAPTADHIRADEGSSSTAKTEISNEDGKARYEKRRAEAAKKREQKASLQADGTLPPSRPGLTSNSSNGNATHESETTSSGPITTRGESLPNKQPPRRESDAQKASTAPPSKTSDPSQAFTKLTPLQQRMAAKLTSARFRHLNQILYTSPSDQAMRLFAESPDAYTSYHAGFRAQVAVWPQNPVEGLIEDIKLRGRIAIPSQKKLWRDQKKGKKHKDESNGIPSVDGQSLSTTEALPRNKQGTCTIADLGCGDATLSSALTPSKKALSLTLLSFDLAKGDTPNASLITVADITNLSPIGIKDASVDIAICCLSLMGTNWVSVVDECVRIVSPGGEIWVAEIKSRFTRPGQTALAKRKNDGIGKHGKWKGKNDAGDANEEAQNFAEVEENGLEPKKDETDVSAFVEVFRKRGLNLKGEPDMTNKLFVRMRFTKAFRPDKVAENAKGGAAKFGEGFKGKQRPETKFLDEGGEDVDESKVLKPCVYKTR